MIASDPIVVSGLIISPGVQQANARWSFVDPRAKWHPNLSLDAVELWHATVNDRNDPSFTKIAEGINEARHYSPGAGEHFYWIRPRNRIDPVRFGDAAYGDWHPSSATGGVQLTWLWQPFTPNFRPQTGAFGGISFFERPYPTFAAARLN